MAEYKSRSRKFLLKGVNLSRPVDALEVFEYAISRNLRGYVDGTIHTRPGAAALNASAMAGGAVHSLKRLNDDVGPVLSTPTQAHARFAGAGTKLYADNSAHNAFTEIASGLSGNPLTWIPFRPEQSPQPWLYIHDSAKLLKAKASAAGDTTKSYQWGINAPTTPLSIAVGTPVRKVVDDCEAGTFGGWVASAGALTNEDRVAAVAISQILFDVSMTGWACVNPAAIGEIREGMDLTTSANAETVTVASVHKAVTTTTIGSIKYDSGTSGLCTIQLAAPTAELEMDSMLRIAAAENVRVLSVTYGPDGIPSFRCSTTGARAAGDAVAGLASFRAYFTNNHTTAETLSGKMLKEVTAAAGITTLTRTVALDLSTFGTRPVLPDDLMVVEMTIDNPSLITEIQFQLDIDAATNDFTKNYLFKSVSPSDLTPLVQQTLGQLTVQQRILQRDQIRGDIGSPLWRQVDRFAGNEGTLLDTGDPISGGSDILGDALPAMDQAATGASQWSVIKFPMSQLLAGRVGSDDSRGLKDVAKIRISINATAVVTVQIDSWYITGSYGADSVLPNSTGNAAAPYFWTYRYRDSRTGDKSPWAPLNRNGFETSRNRLVLTPTVSTDPQVDKIDYLRIGGTLNEFHVIGTGPNSGTFNDDFSDDVAQIGDPVLQGDVRDLIQPFPVVDIPRTGTCDVKGTEVIWKTGDKFNTAAFKDALILINNVPYHLYANPADDQHLSLSENAGTQSSVSFFIPDAMLGGQTLDAVFGPYSSRDNGVVFFGVRQGVLYWTNGNDPSLCRVSNQKEITGGSETLLNGCLYDSRPYMLSNERMFEIVPDGQGGFEEREVANSKGLFAQWGLCVGTEVIYVIAEDGIYASQGGQFEKISQDLGPLLPHDGIAGVSVNGIAPPDFTQPNKMRLEFGDTKLKWSFIDTGSVYRTWVYDTVKKGWESLDKYAFEGLIHYHEEAEGVHSELIGGKDGKVYQVGGTTDGGTAIAGELTTGCEDCGETRSQKQFGDVQLDVNTGSVNVIAKVLTDNLTVESASVTVNNAVRTYQLLDINAGVGAIARNIGLHLTWTGYVVFYEWNPSYVLRADLAIKRATDWYVFPGARYIRGIVIEADTGGVARTVKIQADGVDTGITLTINHSGQISKPYGFVPFSAYSVRLLPTDTTPWQFFEITKWEADDYPDLQTIYTAWSDAGYEGAKFVQGMVLEADTGNLPVALQIQGDEGVVAATVTATHNGRSKKAYPGLGDSWEPFIAHMLRIVPQGSVRLNPPFRVKFIYEPEPESAILWKTQPTTFDWPAFGHVYRAQIAHKSSSDITMTITVDGTDYEYEIPNSGGEYEKVFITLGAIKGKWFECEFRSDARCAIFKKDCLLYGKPWGDVGPYQPLRVFGGDSRTDGATI